MNTKTRPRFDVVNLRLRAGEAVFARGEAYAAEDRVELLGREPHRVMARVAGEADYLTVLTGAGGGIAGRCTCPAYADWGFCKHMVAVALIANAAEAGDTGQDAGALARIREHLGRQSVETLAAMIIDLAEGDQALWRRLELAAALTDEDDVALKRRLVKVIDEATDVPHRLQYGEEGDWADGVVEVLIALEGLLGAARHGLALELVLRAIEGIEDALPEIDDSEGECSGLLERAQEIHLAAVEGRRPDPVALAGDLFARETQSDFDTFSGAAPTYAHVLGEAGMAEYRRLVQKAWDSLPPRSARAEPDAEIQVDHRQLAGMLDGFLEADGDVEARIALRAKILATPSDYIQLAEFCLSQGREGEALRWTEEGLWLFEDDRAIERLESFAVGLFSNVGRQGDAQALLKSMFNRAPSFEAYLKISQHGGDSLRRWALDDMRARLGKPSKMQWQSPADLLARVLVHDAVFEEAWAIVRQYGASASVKQALAQASEAAWPREAVEVYAEQVELLINLSSGDYSQAARLVARMAGLRGAAEQTAYVAALKSRHHRKRNLMKLLG